MTLITAFNVGKSPVVVGDLLLSGPEQPQKEIATPIVGDVTRVFPRGSGWSIVGLRQKVNLVANNCVVAWADNELAAKIVIKELRALSTDSPLSFDRIADYFKNIDPNLVGLGVNIVGWVKEDKGFRRFCFNALTTKTGAFGELSIAGSGTDPFLKLTEEMPLELPIADREINSLEKAVSLSLMSTGLMLQSEFHTQDTLLNFFGGGYEIASFVKDRFSKIGDITFVCWAAELKDNFVYISHPLLALKQDYLNDILLIRSLRLHHSDGVGETTSIEEAHYIVSPLYRTANQEEAQMVAGLNLNSKFTCHCILIQSDCPLQVLVRIEYRESGSPTSITFNDLDGQLSWAVNHEFVLGLAKSIECRYKPNAAQ